MQARLTELAERFAGHGFQVLQAATAEEAVAHVSARADLASALVDWNLDGNEAASADGDGASAAEEVLRALATRYNRLPSFLVTRGESVDNLPLWVSEVVRGYVWLLEDTPDFVAGRIAHAARAYLEDSLPPFFTALRQFEDAHEYSWHTPAHAGGIAFLKSPVGRAFHDYYGERLLRTDLSISVAELGSLFEHTGPIGDAERNAARVFQADQTYFVLHGDSTCDRMVIHASVAQDDFVLVDRNCHKAVYHGLTMTGARPVYLVPTRNGYGLMGPIPPTELEAAAVVAKLAATPFAEGANTDGPSYAVITNSTYDGLCYNTVEVARLLGQTVPRLHLDEAWFAYAAFHPLYARRYGMAVGPETVPEDVRPTVFATQSTHKLLAALSQSAMVHVKSAPRCPVEPKLFNETFMMHGTTSPLYPMIASLDVAAGMMDGAGGRWMLDEAITEAIRFRQAVSRIARRITDAADRPSWFFGTWQPDTVTDPETGVQYPFADAPLDLLRTEPSCWTLAPGADWHGFEELTEGYCMLDPVKVAITCPGVDARGTVTPVGVPARILTSYLEHRGIVVEKTDAYTCLVLFSMGITKGKWGTLLDALIDFKNLYDAGTELRHVLPDLIERFPERYAKLTLPELCEQMHDHLSSLKLTTLLDDAFTHPPRPQLTPAQTYQRLIRGGTQPVRLAELAGRTVATMVVTTPPGIPVLMPGEHAGEHGGPILTYLRTLEDFDRHFPGFEAETHGVTIDRDGNYWINCVTSP